MPKFNFNLYIPGVSYTNLPSFHFDNTPNLRWLYAIRVNRNIISQFSLFFLPIFLFLLGKDKAFLNLNLTNSQKGIVFVAAFYILSRLVSVFSTMMVSRVIVSLGARWSFIFGHLLSILFMAGIFVGHNSPDIVLAMAVIYGLQIPFYWNAYHTLLSELTHKKNLGEDLGLLHFAIQFVSALTPAVGGAIAALYGYQGLFLLGIFWSANGLVISTRIVDKTQYSVPSWKEFVSWLEEKRFRSLSASFGGRVFYDLALRLWPLYVFLILGTVEKVGFLYSVSLFAALFLSLGVGYYIDHHRSRKPFMLSGGVLSLLWALRSLAANAWTIGISDVADKLVSNFHWIFFDAVMFSRGKGDKALSYFAYREVVISMAEIVFWLTVAGMFILNGTWLIVFGMGSLGVLMSLLMKDE